MASKITNDNKVFAWFGDVELYKKIYPSSQTEDYEANFAEHALLGAKPTLQATGVSLITQKWSASLVGALCDVDAEIKRLTTMLNEQKAHALILADGQKAGDFVITNFSVKRLQTLNHKTTHAEIDFTLKEYVETNPLAAKSRVAIEKAPAIKKDSAAKVGSPIDAQKTDSSKLGEAQGQKQEMSSLKKQTVSVSDAPPEPKDTKKTRQQTRRKTTNNYKVIKGDSLTTMQGSPYLSSGKPTRQ